MSLWWLLLLWPLSGYIGWAWFNHMLRSSIPGPDYSPLKWVALALDVLVGPLGLLITGAEAFLDFSPEDRWGLRFW